MGRPLLVADLMRCSSFRRLGTVHLLSGWPVFSPGMQTHTGQCVCSPVARRAASGSGGGAFLVEGVPLAVLAFARLVLVARYSLKWTRTSSKEPSSMRPFGAGSCDDFRMGSCVSCATSGANSLPLPESSTLVIVTCRWVCWQHRHLSSHGGAGCVLPAALLPTHRMMLLAGSV